MRHIFLGLVVLIIFSCNKENDNSQDLSGLYQDSLTYTASPSYIVKDTVILKRIYKVNDSTYKMGPNYNLDTNESTFSSPLRFRIKFILRLDNLIKIDHEGLPYSQFGGNYDPAQLVIHNLRRDDIANPLVYESHTLKRVDQ